MKVRNEIQVYERNGETAPDSSSIVLESHGISSDKVILVVGKERYAVYGSDLRQAVDNAMNHNEQ